jgi:hypothetical protein
MADMSVGGEGAGDGGGPGPEPGPAGPADSQPHHGESLGWIPDPYTGRSPAGPDPAVVRQPSTEPAGPGPDPYLDYGIARLPDPYNWPSAAPESARPRRRYLGRIIVAAVLVAGFAAGSVITARISYAEATRKPTQAELSAAAAAGLAQRWERISAGALFPEHVSYTTDQDTQESASRVGIGTGTSCAAAVDQTISALATRYRCVGAVRATYADALDGTVYTVGVLAFPSARAATQFDQRMPPSTFPAAGLHALAFAGTAAARFDDAARQQSESYPDGPYIVLIVAGYADGRAARSTGEQRSDVFDPADQIAVAVNQTLDAPEVVNCQVKSQWSC